MKCEYCGANLTIDDEVCSFCGSANPFAVKHRKEMHHFTREFNKTKSAVLRESKYQTKWAVKITLIAIMLAANLLVWFFIGNSYDIEQFVVSYKVNAQYSTHKKAMDEYEANREYIALSYYYNENQLYFSERFKEYRAVSDVCSQYSSIYRNLMGIVTKESDEYYSHEKQVEYISDQLDYLYRASVKSTYDDAEKYAPVHQECMDDVVAQVELLIQTYLGVSDEDIAGFREMSKARRQIVMEEGLKFYE